MNFKELPELEWDYGYPAVLLLMAAICGLPLPRVSSQRLALARSVAK